MRCLWLMAHYPYPTTSGIAMYGVGAARALAGAGARVTALGLAPPEPVPAPDDGLEWRLVGGGIGSRRASLVSPLPAMAYAVATPAYRQALADALDRERWDAVVLDHLQTGWAVGPVRTRSSGPGPAPVLVHLSHNHETTVRAEVARQMGGGWRGAALRLDAAKVGRLERTVVGGADVVTAITEDDLACFAAMPGDGARLLLPPGYDGHTVARRTIAPSLPRRAVVLTNLDWHVKRDNLRRFLDVADPLFAAAGAELWVVGDGPADFIRAEAGRRRATTLTGRVESVTDALASARVGIVAEPAGGGFKMKALDYVFHRVPMAVLAGSAAGLPLVPGRDVLVYGDERRLAEGVLAVLDDVDALDALQGRAFAACAGRFDWSARGAALYEAITS